MTIDFDGFVLSPLMDLFALTDVTIVPTVSQPDASAYPARAVWDAKPYTVMLENQAPLSSSTYTVGLRLNDFVPMPPPTQGDQIIINGLTYELDAPSYDGQGGVQWTVKGNAAGLETPTI